MYRFSKKECGAVSVFLVIILVPCMLVASIFVDVGRVHLSKTMAESAAEMALNSLMTHYDSDLNDWYGMVASCQSIEEFYDISEKYYISALKSQNLSDEDISTLVGNFRAMIGEATEVSDFLRVSETGEDSTSISPVDGANLANSTMLKAQIVDFMKYRAPLAITESVIDRIRDGSLAGVDEALESDENKELVDEKKEFCEAEAKLMEDSYYTYKYLYDNYSNASPAPNNELLTGCLSDMQSYREAYRELNQLLVTNLYNTSGLAIFNRAVVELNAYNYTKSSTNCYQSKYDGTTYWVKCHSRKEGDTYYIDGTDLEKQFADIDQKIKDFDNAKKNFTNKVNNDTSYSAGSTNDIQYWKHAQDSYNTNNGLETYRTDLSKKAEAMIKSYCVLKAMMTCEIGTEMPENYENTYNTYKTSVENRQSKYLTAGKTDASDSYLVLVNRLENISSNNIYKIEPDSLTVGDGTVYSVKISNIAASLSGKREELQKYSDVLKVVIDGDSSKNVKSIAELKQDAIDYADELSDWESQANSTSTDMASKDRDDINGIKSSEASGNITEESITNLETRLKNIKSQIDSVITAIDNFKYGGKKVIEITNYDQFKNAASSVIKVDDINSKITNSALQNYANSSFTSLFSPNGSSSDAIMTINSSDNYNLKLDVNVSKTVSIPGLYQFWHDKFNGANSEKLDEYKSDKGSAENKQEELENNAKNRANPHSDSQNITAEIDTLNRTFGTGTMFSSFISLIGNLVNGNFEEIRDDLYISTYMLNMFSYSTVDNEGRYDLLKDTGFDMKTLNKSNYTSKYETVDERWASTEYKDYFNKSLTNKMINKDNNAAYGCELEYILYGKSNDENIKSAYGQIYQIRYALNLVSGFQHFWNVDNATGIAFNTIASAISTATYGIVPAAIVKVVLIALLTVFETASDLNRLEAGFATEIYKNQANMWQISLDFGVATSSTSESISGMISTLTSRFEGGFSNSCENGLRYSDYLCIFIVCGMQSDIGEAMTLRCADIIQTNMRKVTSKESYKLANAKTYFSLESQLKVDPLLITLPLYSDYTEAYDSTNTDWCTYDIKKIRGY